ncbi:hypothetical protein WJX77_010024 [Trebouxia sp. C0004]
MGCYSSRLNLRDGILISPVDDLTVLLLLEHTGTAHFSPAPCVGHRRLWVSNQGVQAQTQVTVHSAAPLPSDEDARLNALNSLGILDTAHEQRFDDITDLVCSIFNVPIAIVSLLDKERQWFKSCVGLNCNQTDRKSSFCAWTLVPKNPEVLVVPDATEDVRFQANPLVLNDPFIRFYAGAPLVTTQGHRLGSLCIIDRQQRHFDAENCRLLCNFAEVVVREIEKDEARAAEQRSLERVSGYQQSLEAESEGILLVDTSTQDWNILFQNEAWLRVTGMTQDEVHGGKLWHLFTPAGQTREQVTQEYQQAISKQLSFTLHLFRGRPTSASTCKLVVAHFKAAATEHISSRTPLVGVPGSVAWRNGEAGHLYFVTVQQHEEPDVGGRDEVQQGVEAGPINEAFEDVQLGPLLGQGGFGKVYRGLWNGAAVAVKIIQHSGRLPVSEGGTDMKVLSRRPERQVSELTTLTSPSRNSTRPQHLEAGNVEGILTLQLSHPNVVQTFKAATRPLQSYCLDGTEETEDEQLFETWLLLEYCDKGSLEDAVDRGCFHADQNGHIDSQTKPNMRAIRATAHEIAAALAYLHSQDLLHGDLTGGNILLASSDADERGFCAKVADFGLSRTLGSEPVDTGTYGTVTHMPPELLTTGKLSKSADVYAFGVLLWEMYTGQRPWSGLGQMQVIFHLTQRKKRLQFPSDTPPQLQDLGTRCMSAEATERPKFDEVLRLVDKLDVDQ